MNVRFKNMQRTALLISCCFLFVSSLKAQTENQILSEIEIKEKLAAQYLEEGRIVDAIELTKENVVLVEKYNDIEQKIKAYIHFAKANLKAASYVVSEEYLTKAQALCTGPATEAYQLEIEYLRANTKLQLGEIEEALKTLLLLHSIILNSNGQQKDLIEIKSNISVCYILQNEFDSALFYNDQIIALQEGTNNFSSLSNALQNKAYILMETNRLDSVISLINYSMSIAQKINSIELESEAYFLLAHYYYKTNNLDESLKYLRISEKLIKGKGLLETEELIFHLYFDIFSQKKEHEKALEWYIKKEVLKDSLENMSFKNKFSVSEINHEIKEKELQMLVQSKELATNRVLIIMLIIALFLLLLVFVVQRRLLILRKKVGLSLEEKNVEIADQNEELQQQQGFLLNKNNFIENRNTRLQSFLSQLEQLTKSYHINKGKKKKAFKEICKLTHECLNVSRVSIWKFDANNNSIIKEILFENGQFDEEPTILYEKDYPKYFEAIKQKSIVASNDAVKDDITSEFANGYLDVLNIKSMIDAPYLFNGEFAGVICCEQIEEFRSWDPEDTIFLKSLSDFISITLLSEQSRSHNKELKIINESLEDTVSKRTSELEEQNDQLREYAFINSHLLRAPLARVLGLAFLLSKEATSIKDKEIISNLLSSTEELDQIVKNISDILFDGNNLTREDILAMIGKKLDTTNNG